MERSFLSMNKAEDNKVFLVIVHTSKLKFEDLSLLGFVTKEDIENADRFVNDNDKVAHLVSSYLKRKYVGTWQVNENGKPISHEKYFNVSHCERAVVLALATWEIGVDVENIKSIDEDLKRYITTDEEYNKIKTDKDFFEIWTSKESLVKADGAGIDRRVTGIPAIPLIGEKSFKGEKYFSRLIQIDELIISVTKKGVEPFEVVIEKERII